MQSETKAIRGLWVISTSQQEHGWRFSQPHSLRYLSWPSGSRLRNAFAHAAHALTCGSDMAPLTMEAFPAFIIALPILGIIAWVAGWKYAPPEFTNLVRKNAPGPDGNANLQEKTAAGLEEILISEGLGSLEELKALQGSTPAVSLPGILLEQERIDERRFTAIWSRASGLEQIIATPEDIDPETLWPESTARRWNAIPVERVANGKTTVAFVEPPGRESLRAAEQHLGCTILPRLITPSNLASLCDTIYPGRVLRHRRIPFQPLFDSLDQPTRRSVREIQMSQRVSIGSALERLAVLPRHELREINALACGAAPADTADSTLGIPFLRTLTPLFCELHGILPLNNGAIAINHPPHPETTAKIHDILGDAVSFQCDTPEAFSSLWNDFTALRFSQDALLEHLLGLEIISIANAERLREARKLLGEPIDKVLLRLALASPCQIFHAIRSTSTLDIAGNDAPADCIEDILTDDQRTHTGMKPFSGSPTGVVFHTTRLPSPHDSMLIMRRCEGVPWKFELSTAWRDSPPDSRGSTPRKARR